MSRPEVTPMKSQNFEFLRPRHHVLADLGGYAEAYAHSDPQAALTKLRLQLEFVIGAVYDTYRLDRPYSTGLFDLMNHDSFCAAVPEVVRSKMHLVRKAGNDAAHGKLHLLSPALALDRLHAAFDVAVWFHLAVDRGDRAACPTYQAPPPGVATNGKAREALEKVRLIDAQYQAVIAELEAERTKRLDAERKAEQATRATEVRAGRAARRGRGRRGHPGVERTRHPAPADRSAPRRGRLGCRRRRRGHRAGPARGQAR
jgi:type I restriction enzyme R subunit